MPEDNHFTFIMPLGHYTIYSSSVMSQIISENRRSGHIISKLWNDSARESPINAAISMNDPKLLWGIGHGGPDIYTVECMDVYMTCGARGDRNMDKVGGRVVVLNSCLTARELGPAIISAGALSYVGSREEFWFYIGSPPGSDRASKSVFLADHQFVASLMSNKPTGTARSDQLARYDEEIDYWTTGPGNRHPHASLIVRCLQIDREISVFLGRTDVTVSTAAPIPAWTKLVELVAGATPVAVVGAAMAWEQLPSKPLSSSRII